MEKPPRFSFSRREVKPGRLDQSINGTSCAGKLEMSSKGNFGAQSTSLGTAIASLAAPPSAGAAGVVAEGVVPVPAGGVGAGSPHPATKRTAKAALRLSVSDRSMMSL
jgi:hypothetical protein